MLDFKGEQMEQCVLLDVLQTAVSDQPLVDMAVLAAPMDSSLEFLSRKKDWYSFLLSMYQQFNSYRVQVSQTTLTLQRRATLDVT